MLHGRPASRPRQTSIGDEVASWLTATPTLPLTDRQWEVLSRLASGQPASRIADDLGLSRQRIYQIVANVRRKLGADPRRT